MYTNLYCCRNLRKLEFSLQSRGKKKSSKTKFHQNPSSGSRVVPCGQMDRRTDGDVTKLIVAFRKSENANKKKRKFSLTGLRGLFSTQIKQTALLNESDLNSFIVHGNISNNEG
jgi:hypothetical protein